MESLPDDEVYHDPCAEEGACQLPLHAAQSLVDAAVLVKDPPLPELLHRRLGHRVAVERCRGVVCDRLVVSRGVVARRTEAELRVS